MFSLFSLSLSPSCQSGGGGGDSERADIKSGVKGPRAAKQKKNTEPARKSNASKIEKEKEAQEEEEEEEEEEEGASIRGSLSDSTVKIYAPTVQKN